MPEPAAVGAKYIISTVAETRRKGWSVFFYHWRAYDDELVVPLEDRRHLLEKARVLHHPFDGK